MGIKLELPLVLAWLLARTVVIIERHGYYRVEINRAWPVEDMTCYFSTYFFPALLA